MNAEQYFAREPETPSEPVACGFVYRGRSFVCRTDAGVFSKGELDAGTELLLNALPGLSGDVLDMGCGWGPIGIAVAAVNPAARVTMTDVNRRALRLAEANAAAAGVCAEFVESDGFLGMNDRKFDAVITNPPIRAGKAVVYRMLAEAGRALRPGGALYLVIRKQQGADSCRKYLNTIFGSTEILARSAGFRVLRATEYLGGGPETETRSEGGNDGV